MMNVSFDMDRCLGTDCKGLGYKSIVGVPLKKHGQILKGEWKEDFKLEDVPYTTQMTITKFDSSLGHPVYSIDLVVSSGSSRANSGVIVNQMGELLQTSLHGPVIRRGKSEYKTLLKINGRDDFEH